MTDPFAQRQPRWLMITLALARLVVLGGLLFYFMTWAEGRLAQFHDQPFLSIAVQIGLALAAISLYLAYGKFIERRDVVELSRPGIGREWGVGILIGVGLYTACAVALMLLGYYQIKGFNPVAFALPAVALAIKSGTFEELIF